MAEIISPGNRGKPDPMKETAELPPRAAFARAAA